MLCCLSIHGLYKIFFMAKLDLMGGAHNFWPSKVSWHIFYCTILHCATAKSARLHPQPFVFLILYQFHASVATESQQSGSCISFIASQAERLLVFQTVRDRMNQAAGRPVLGRAVSYELAGRQFLNVHLAISAPPWSYIDRLSSSFSQANALHD